MWVAPSPPAMRLRNTPRSGGRSRRKNASRRPQAELERKLTNQGWKVKRAKITNGCCEVYGRDEKNRKVEVRFHPKTFELVTEPK